MAHPLPQDKRAGYIGLVVSLIAIVVTVIVVSMLTARSFESHGPPPGAPAAGQAPAAR